MNILDFWIIIGVFVGGFFQIMFALWNDDKLSFKTPFWYVMTFYENNKDKLNSIGLIIIIVAISLLLLPGYISIFIIMCLYKAFCELWEIYKYVFRKKKKVK